jgi:hypothetical protein
MRVTDLLKNASIDLGAKVKDKKRCDFALGGLDG